MIDRLLIGLVRGYKRIVSPLLPPACRFMPTCSEYAAVAIATHGPLRGVWLATLRLLRCHPFSRGGLDNVPTQFPIPFRRQTRPQAISPHEPLP